MKKLLSLISLLFAMTAISGSALSGSQDRNGNQGVKDRFVGAWRLVSLEAPNADGQFIKPTPPGCLSLHATGTPRYR
jgi:hypothetical protein